MFQRAELIASSSGSHGPFLQRALTMLRNWGGGIGRWLSSPIYTDTPKTSLCPPWPQSLIPTGHCHVHLFGSADSLAWPMALGFMGNVLCPGLLWLHWDPLGKGECGFPLPQILQTSLWFVSGSPFTPRTQPQGTRVKNPFVRNRLLSKHSASCLSPNP